MRIMQLLRKYPVASFYVLAFVLAWAGRVPLAMSSYGLFSLDPLTTTFLFILGGAAPTLAALAVALALKGGKGPDVLFEPFRRWRVGLFWYLIALLAPFLATVAGLYADMLFLGGPAPDWARFEWAGLPFMFLSVFISYVWEEVGWRGFALPRLQERYSAFFTSLVMGLLAFLWHLPLSLNKSLPIFSVPLFFQLIFHLAITLWFTWLYNNTRGSLLLVSIFHASLNVTAGLSMSVVGESGFIRQYPVVTVLYLITAALFVLACGARHLSRQSVSESIAMWKSASF